METERSELGARIAALKASGFDYLVKITAVDYVDHIDVVYILRNIEKKEEQVLEVNLDPADLWVPTLVQKYAAADWYERIVGDVRDSDKRKGGKKAAT